MIIRDKENAWPCFYYYTKAPETDPIEKKIDELKKLSPGWNYGSGGPISDKLADMAKRLCHYGRIFGYRINVFPGYDSHEVCLTFYAHDDLTIEIIINENAEYDISVERGFGENFDILEDVERADWSRVIETLKKFSGIQPEQCISSESSTLDSTIEKKEDSQVWHSETQAGEEYLVLMLSA